MTKNDLRKIITNYFEGEPLAEFPTQEELALSKLWITQRIEIFKYEEMELEHIENILNLFEQGTLEDRTSHLKGLQQEILRRHSIAGKVLF